MKAKSESVSERNTLSLFVVSFSFLFYYGKQIFFVVKVKVHVAFCDNPWQLQNYLFLWLLRESKKNLNLFQIKVLFILLVSKILDLRFGFVLFGANGGTRTLGLSQWWFRKITKSLFWDEMKLTKLELMEGLEPSVFRLRIECFTN